MQGIATHLERCVHDGSSVEVRGHWTVLVRRELDTLLGSFDVLTELILCRVDGDSWESQSVCCTTDPGGDFWTVNGHQTVNKLTSGTIKTRDMLNRTVTTTISYKQLLERCALLAAPSGNRRKSRVYMKRLGYLSSTFHCVCYTRML